MLRLYKAMVCCILDPNSAQSERAGLPVKVFVVKAQNPYLKVVKPLDGRKQRNKHYYS